VKPEAVVAPYRATPQEATGAVPAAGSGRGSEPGTRTVSGDRSFKMCSGARESSALTKRRHVGPSPSGGSNNAKPATSSPVRW
jgi:hypothetical protein